MLENLNTAPKITQSPFGAPSVEINGDQGTATTPGLKDGQDYTAYLVDAGLDPDTIEVIGTPRISRWQVYDESWRTAYRFNFRVLAEPSLDLPLLYRQAKGKAPKPPVKKLLPKAMVILWSDLQVGKQDNRGGLTELIERINDTRARLIDQVKREKPEKIVFADVGDIIEGFTSSQDTQQVQSNVLSIMGQVDLATTMTWDTLKELAKHSNDITYLSVGSNHCQWRVNKQRVGTALDDWGIHIARTLARLAKEVGLPIKFYEPSEYDEALCHDVFGDNFHRLGLFHGHQARRPDSVPAWLQGQMLGNQAIAPFTVAVSGHFHHLQVRELGMTERSTSRFWVQAKTLDNGSTWYRQTAGHDSGTGLVTFVLERDKEFSGTVMVV